MQSRRRQRHREWCEETEPLRAVKAPRSHLAQRVNNQSDKVRVRCVTGRMRRALKQRQNIATNEQAPVAHAERIDNGACMQRLQARNKRTAKRRAGPKHECAREGGEWVVALRLRRKREPGRKEGRLSHGIEFSRRERQPYANISSALPRLHPATHGALGRKCKFLQSADELVCMRRQLLRVARALGGGRAFWRDSANRKGSAQSYLQYIFFLSFFLLRSDTRRI